jgi:alkylation response protein AidB-like acyl-CoA dehydrogenase
MRVEVLGLGVWKSGEHEAQRQREAKDAGTTHHQSLDAIAASGIRGCGKKGEVAECPRMPFFQTPPELGNQFTDDLLLNSYLERVLPEEMRREIMPELGRLGELAGGPLYRQSVAERLDEPELVQWDAWGNRIDHIEITPLWKRAAVIAAEEGLVAIPYERRDGASSRVHQFAKVYLFDASTGVYTCPLAMTDGAAKTLGAMGNAAILERALPRLTSRDPNVAWTSGQWMTERTGGSDVAISETVARKDGDAWRLTGTKWFTSATTSQMALTLGRPEGNPPGGAGLALFYVEMRDDAGRLREGIRVNRLKDKLGTRMVPTAELTLDGARALAVRGATDGIKNITPMLAITRTWNAVCAVAGMRRGLALAHDYAKRRVAFGAPLAQKPLHADTLAGLEAEYEGAFLLAFRTVELLGKEEARTITEDEQQVLRLLTPLAKLTTGKQAVGVASEVLEAFGGAGYVEDTGLPRILRDAQVLPIWEGTTNVLSLDVLRALARSAGLEALGREIERATRGAHASLAKPAEAAKNAMAHAARWAHKAKDAGPEALEAGARRFAMTLGRATELALLVEHATWALARDPGARFAAAARRFAAQGVDWIRDDDETHDTRALLA